MERTRDVLDHVRSFHEKLADYYARLEGRSERARVCLLLEYLSGHERHLADTLMRYEEKASRGVLNTWFKFSPEDKLRSIQETDLSADMSCDEVVAAALELDERILDFYRDMASRAENPQVRELFEDLLQMERNEERQLTRNALALGDI